MQTSTSEPSSTCTITNTMAVSTSTHTNISDGTLRRLSEKLGVGWESLATYLGLSANRVTCIKMDYRSEGTEEQIFLMLWKWKNDFHQEPNKDGMKEVLKKALINHGRRDLAIKVEQGTLGPEEQQVCGRRENVDCLTDEILRKLSNGLARGWEQLATQLGVSNAQVGKLKRDYNGVGEQIFQMLLKWRNGNNSDKPVDVLNNALRQIGNTSLAVKLMDMIDRRI